MPRKFSVGEKARIVPPPRPRWWPKSIRPGRIVTIKAIFSRGPHCYYESSGRKHGSRIFRSDELRQIDESTVAGGKRQGAGRPRSNVKGV